MTSLTALICLLNKTKRSLVGQLVISTGMCYISTFYGAWPEYRRKGIGSKLMGMIESESQNKSIQKLFVDTYALQAQEFYKKHGFKIIGCAPEYLLEHDRIFMRKDI